MKIGVLTGGGDCPGLNAAIRAVVRTALRHDDVEVVGVKNGWKGLLDAEAIPLDRSSVAGILARGGTILGSTPSHTFKGDVKLQTLVEGYRALGLDCLIIIGGDSTLEVAARMSEQGLNIIGIPKTIDNDIAGTERTIGFSTAVMVACEAIDRVHSTAESHHRVMIVEVMGRNAGWIAITAGLAGGADLILIPEKPFVIEEVLGKIRDRHKTRDFSIVVIAEGAYQRGGDVQVQEDEIDAFGYHTLGGVANWLRKEISDKLDFDSRAIILGHTQRGGSPTVEDRILATRFGARAMELAYDGVYGDMVALKNDTIQTVPLKEAIKDRVVDEYWQNL